jgi:hypothetical protein
MSDYLGNLVSRFLLPDGSVRPRVPSLFEPTPAGEAVPAEEPSPPSLSSSSVQEPPLPLHAGPVNPISSSSVATLPASGLPPPGGEPIRPPQPDLPGGPASPPPLRNVVRPPRGAEEDRRTMRAEGGIPLEAPARPEHEAAGAPDARIALKAEVPPEPPPIPNGPPSPDRETVVGLVLQEFPRLLAPQPILRSDRPFTGMGAISSPERPARRQGADPFSSPPSQPERPVQVTIGRVEIRAALSSPARPPRPSRSPAMTLEEYLRRRSGAEPRRP